MKKNSTLFLLLFLFLIVNSCQAQKVDGSGSTSKTKNTIVYFNPEIEPELDEIKAATFTAFFTAVSDYFSSLSNTKMLRVQMPVDYNNVNTADVSDACKYNEAKYAVVPKVKFFKVGFGKYILSSQVVVSMKLYDAEGNFLSENSYDTFRKQARILGSAENSVKTGTKGVLKMMVKDWRRSKKQ